MPYGYIGSMRTTPGHRHDVVAILLAGSVGLRQAGCLSYIVGASTTDDDVIWVTEVWESAAHHDASLELPETRAAIGGPCRCWLVSSWVRRPTSSAGSCRRA